LKLKVLGWILITFIGVVVLDQYNLLGRKTLIEVQAHYMQYNCSEANIDMRVTAVSDSTLVYLIGKTIAPELFSFDHDELTQLVFDKTAAFRAGRETTMADFTLVGYIRQSQRKHCSGAICFGVEKIKYAGDGKFVEF
jgi:hypothetical protein